ncbi:MAG: phytoene/squalene synthase family protein [Thaumarchaeota archaeon]|nr:phytoene/squalene synthase family protein [Candidatus Calditenuaceae archaeon]MDW8042008.1 phytoene/squalene synthase family protein [Nitrososphaerota archaeon]
MIPREDVQVDPAIFKLFKRGSMTYFNSTLFFPNEVRRDVFRLYAFLRKADNFVDSVPQDAEGFYAFRREYERAARGHDTSDVVIREFIALSRERDFDERWIEAFLDSMEADLYKRVYNTIDELLVYVYGSAEVVGLFMARILGLSEESFIYARFLGRAMQYINFIRDIQEDLELGRQYLPMEEMRRYGISSLEPTEALEKRDGFTRFIRDQIRRYLIWQKFAEEGYSYIPYRYLIPIKTAADMYKLTARIIYSNPTIVYVRKVKPKKTQIFSRAYTNLVCAIRYVVPGGNLACG